MRLKKRYLAAIIVFIIIVVAALASVIYSSVQAERIAYIAVHADKDVFTSDENVTFQLVPLTEGVQFTVEGGDGMNGYGVHVIRIPDSVDPKEVVTNVSLLNDIYSWDHGRVILPVDSFNSTGEPLRMSWDGTLDYYEYYTEYETYAEDEAWANARAKATSGYYILCPYLQWSYGHITKFMLDEGAIFYYDSLNVNITTDRSKDSFSMSMNISLGKDMPEGEYKLFSRLQPMSYEDGQSGTRLNQNFTLMKGGSVHIDLGPIKADEYSSATYDAVIRGPNGELYAFGFNKGVYEGWYYDYRY